MPFASVPSIAAMNSERPQLVSIVQVVAGKSKKVPDEPKNCCGIVRLNHHPKWFVTRVLYAKMNSGPIPAHGEGGVISRE